MAEQELIDRIRNENDIVEVISSYIPLKKSGANFKANCPFHDEKTPSFVVSQSKQIYRCFGCGKSGNVITFVRDYEKISFIEALKKLAERVAIPFSFNKKKQKSSRTEMIYSSYKLANDHFMYNFKTYGGYAGNFLVKRQISKEIIEMFEIGYSLDSYSALVNYLVKNGINKEILLYTGMFKRNQNGVYDFFRNRVMFPIYSVNGRVIAFGGRVLSDDNKLGKYINSPTTDVYVKGDHLYGFFKTRYDIAKKDYSIVCEGYMDFLRLYSVGIVNCVASLGTALTEKQVNLLARYSQNIILLYDGDKAGRKAAFKAARIILSYGCEAKIVLLPEKDDPDSYILNYGKDALIKLIENAYTFIDALKNETCLDLSVKQKLNLAMDVANKIPDLIKQELFVRDVSETFSISEDSLKSKLITVKKNKPYENNEILKSFSEERSLIKIILGEPNLFNEIIENIEPESFDSSEYKEIYLKIIELFQKENISEVSVFIDKFEKKLADILGEIILEDNEDINPDEIVNNMRIKSLMKQLKEIEKKIKIAGNNLDPQLIKYKMEIKSKLAENYKSVTWKL